MIKQLILSAAILAATSSVVGVVYGEPQTDNGESLYHNHWYSLASDYGGCAFSLETNDEPGRWAGAMVAIRYKYKSCDTPIIIVSYKDNDPGFWGTRNDFDIKPGDVQYRVDIHPVHNNHTRSTDTLNSYLNIYEPIAAELLEEMRAGSTLRIKVKDWPALGVSLDGFTAATTRAQRLCYEEVGPYHDSYFK
ncbi:MAG: hypothetical protein ABFS24_13755 [Pseudomonadota bacterium]